MTNKLLGALLGALFHLQPGFAASIDTSADTNVNLGHLPSVLADPHSAFLKWLGIYQRPYLQDKAVFLQRLAVFRANAELVQAHNTRQSNYQLALNEFSDLTFEEFQTRLGYKPSMLLQASEKPGRGAFRHSEVEAPAEIDWTTRGAVTQVKNQGSCGSCWAFSTTGAIEGINQIVTGQLKVISEQELVDCDREEDAGCGGGLMDNAFSYVYSNGGIDTEKDYQYWGAFPSFCNRRKQADRHVVDITGFEDVPSNDEHALAQAVSQQPVSVAICANSAMQFYKSGVFDGPSCTQLNHGVLAVGYGEDPQLGKFWKVKNSWGSGWGEDGYIRMKKDSKDVHSDGSGMLGIAMQASYPAKDDLKNPVVPKICDAQLFSLFECPADKNCQCDFNLFGFLCLTYSCVPQDAVHCDPADSSTWCPVEAPTCNWDHERCSGDDGLNSAMLFSEPARFRYQK